MVQKLQYLFTTLILLTVISSGAMAKGSLEIEGALETQTNFLEGPQRIIKTKDKRVYVLTANSTEGVSDCLQGKYSIELQDAVEMTYKFKKVVKCYHYKNPAGYITSVLPSKTQQNFLLSIKTKTQHLRPCLQKKRVMIRKPQDQKGKIALGMIDIQLKKLDKSYCPQGNKDESLLIAFSKQKEVSAGVYYLMIDGTIQGIMEINDEDLPYIEF